MLRDVVTLFFIVGKYTIIDKLGFMDLSMGLHTITKYPSSDRLVSSTWNCVADTLLVYVYLLKLSTKLTNTMLLIV